MSNEEQVTFIGEFNNLQEKYKVQISVVLYPMNLLTRILKRVIRVRWDLRFVDIK